MTDLRALDIEDRRALAAEAERWARAGETPEAICAALGLSLSTYRRWAALFGFRLCDLDPDHPMSRGGGRPKGSHVLPRPEALRASEAEQVPDRRCAPPKNQAEGSG